MRLRDITAAVDARDKWLDELLASAETVVGSLQMIATQWTKEGHPEPEQSLGHAFQRQIDTFRRVREADPESGSTYQ